MLRCRLAHHSHCSLQSIGGIHNAQLGRSNTEHCVVGTNAQIARCSNRHSTTNAITANHRDSWPREICKSFLGCPIDTCIFATRAVGEFGDIGARTEMIAATAHDQDVYVGICRQCRNMCINACPHSHLNRIALLGAIQSKCCYRSINSDQYANVF